MYSAFKKLEEEKGRERKRKRRRSLKEGIFFLFLFEMGTQDYKMESVNKRHFLGTTFKDALSLSHYITKQIFIIIYSGRIRGGGGGGGGGGGWLGG